MKLENPQQAAQVTRAPAVPVHPSYRPDIDGLRAVAVLSVVLFHAFPGKLPGGFVGVDIFFVISGYLIGTILLANLRRGTLDFADFYARRVLRIFPALALVLAATLAFGWFGLFADEYKQLGKHVLGGAGYISNIFLWNEVGYFDTSAETKPLLHLWSLAIEEQFYIVWPLVLLGAARLRLSLLKTILAVLAVSFLVNIGGVHRFPTATFYSPASRVWELLVGGAIAWFGVYGVSLFGGVMREGRVTARGDFSSVRARNRLAWAGLALIALALLLVRREQSFPGNWALLPVLGAALLIVAGPLAWVNRVLLSNRVMVGVGLISYPLYLWHWPLLSYARIVEGDIPERPLKLVLLGASVLLAWATWRFVERPLRYSSARRRVRVAGLVLAVCALGGLGAFVYQSEGLPQRSAVVDTALQQKDLVLVEDVENAKACKARYGFDSLYRYCLMDDVTREPTVALLGDSHAYHIVAGQMMYWHARGENLVMFGTRVPFIGLPGTGDEYQLATPGMLELALNTPSIKTVILSTALSLHQGADEKARFLPALRETLRQFTAKGKRVIYVADTPKLEWEPRTCIGRGAVPTSKTRIDCAIPRTAYTAQLAANADVISVLKEFPSVLVFDPTPAFCDDRKCHVKQNDILVYRDTHHLSYRGDLLVGEEFARWANLPLR